MSIKVDSPPVVRIPDKLLNDPSLAEFFIQQQNIIYQLYRRTGGSNDLIDDIDDSVSAEDSRKFVELRNMTKKVNELALCIADIQSQINRLQSKKEKQSEEKNLESRFKKIQSQLNELQLMVN